MGDILPQIDKGETIDDESKRATLLLAGKVVARVFRHRQNEVGIEFTDGTRFFIDAGDDCLELSIAD